jgi:topoisomerase-4 subunit A
MANLEPLMQKNFLEYASYSILDRAIPDLRDGCKPVQRRVLQTLFEMQDGRLQKVAGVIGETMKLHPHGDTSIFEALVGLANKGFFIERQGNFGNTITGHPPAAPRYIECRLTPLALETLFNEELTECVESYDGRKREPVCLPAKIPVVLMLGVEGIAVGMATRIFPHCFCELLEAQIKWLRGQDFELYPDFQQGALMDASDYDAGRGKVRVRARIAPRGDKKVVITEIPYSTTTEGLIASIEAASQRGRVKISGINDFTTDAVEIELALARGVYADEVIPQLYAYTDCEVTLSSSITVIRDRRPVQLQVPEIVGLLTEQLRETLQKELERQLDQLEDRQHWVNLERIFIEKGVYKRIEKARTAERVMAAVRTGMEKYADQFPRALSDEDLRRLLEIRIRRISAYDIERNRRQLEEIAEEVRVVCAKLDELTQTTIEYVEGLLARYGDLYPRRTELQSFGDVDRRAVARQDIKLGYDAKTGFLGSEIRGNDLQLSVSEFDRILVISNDGTYRIMAPPAKVLIQEKLAYCGVFDAEQGAGFTVVYRDCLRNAFGKRIHIQGFIHDKEYRLFKDEEGRLDLLIPDGDELGTVQLAFVPMKRQRVKEGRFDLARLEPTGINARGTRLAPKPVARIRHLRGRRRGARA